MVEVVETLEAKLKRHEDALIACMAEITKLREENARLRSSENNAHSVLREVYNDPTASPAVRVKALAWRCRMKSPGLRVCHRPWTWSLVKPNTSP
jgi:FtsZ-binding cell division protein ZapB